MRRLATHGTLVALLLLTAAPRAWAWGCAGHQIVAYLAWAHLRPQVRARAERLLAGMPLDQAACWADSVRTAATAPWHFVQLPLNARPNAADYARYCNHDCLTWALLRFETQLGPGPSAQRTTALYYVIHLTGDATQPLHASDDDDNGGNCVRTRLPGARRASNLHADWDTQLLRPLLAQAGPAAYAATLDRRFGRRYARSGTQPAAWVWQAHALAVHDAYGPLHIAPGCKTTPIHLSAAYVRQADRDIAIQLDRAGWRLAAVLNQLLVGAGPSAASPCAPLTRRPDWGPREPQSGLRVAGAAPASFARGGESASGAFTPFGIPLPFAPTLPTVQKARPPRMEKP